MRNIIITTECVADLPQELVERYGIGIIYYTVKTDEGEFRDTDEVTAPNIMEYMMGGKKKALSVIPTVSHYEDFFREKLQEGREIIHISISGDVSGAFENAKAACESLGEDKDRIRVIDSRHLSSGQGLLVLEAARCCEEGKGSREIEGYVRSLIPRVSTSFLAYNADYLYYNDKVPEKVMKLCRNLSLHPVLAMSDGKLTLKKVYMGSYQKCAARYLRTVTAKGRNIRKNIGFITYAGCSHKNLEYIHEVTEKRVGFGMLYEQPASASISCNCGPYTFGILYIRNE